MRLQSRTNLIRRRQQSTKEPSNADVKAPSNIAVKDPSNIAVKEPSNVVSRWAIVEWTVLFFVVAIVLDAIWKYVYV